MKFVPLKKLFDSLSVVSKILIYEVNIIALLTALREELGEYVFEGFFVYQTSGTFLEQNSGT